MAIAVSSFGDDGPQASIKMMDGNNMCVQIHDASWDQTVCMTMDEAVAISLWILRQSWELPAIQSIRAKTLSPRRNGDE